MNKPFFLWLLCLVFTFKVSNAQKDFKLGKPSKELVTQSEHPIEKDARAAIIYRKERCFFDFTQREGFSLVKDVEIRVKIYNKEGMDWATFEIPLYHSGSEEEKIMSIKGYTFNAENGKIVTSKLKSDGKFKENRNKYWSVSKITMPNAREGSVIDLHYKTVSPFIFNVGEFVFQYDIPVDEIHAKIDIPEYLKFKTYSKGFFPISYQESMENRKLSFTQKNNNRVNDFGLKSGSNYSQEELNVRESIYLLSAQNIPSLKEEKYTSNIDNYRTALTFELSSTQWPGETYKLYSQTWENVAKSIYQLSSFGNELDKKGYYEEDLEALIGGVSDKMQRAALVYNYVQQKMTWNQFNSVTTDVGVRKAFKDGVGNVAEINLMLVSMLRHAGVNANPVLVSTRSHGIPLFPTREGFNYVIAAIEIENGLILLDATEKYAYPNVLPKRVLNWNGRLIREDGSSSGVNLIPKKPSKETYSMNVTLDDAGIAEGKIRVHSTDQTALFFRQNIKPMVREQYLERLEDAHGGIEISDYEIQNANDVSKPIVETYSFYAEDAVEIIGDKMYISPLLFMAINENPFKLEKREYPIDFTYPKHKKYMVNIKLPEGFKIESVPENIALKLPEDMGMFRYTMTVKDNLLQLLTSTEIDQAVIPAHYYDSIKEFYKQMIDKENEKVVLTKA
ncbi:DUF3857 domain-containing protein [Ascidiimonas aurantiaca]|uniref:DUF3857 domain-containing protein n=1 Tax=Ascidiimonas aurantiaca TaxID=1685432 RepID=UPI0030EE6A1F